MEEPTICRLPNVEFMACRGLDAADFLQRQTTQNVAALPAGASALAGWLDARGRVRAVLRALRLENHWLIAVSDQSAAALIDALRVFVLRSKVELESAGEWRAVALVGNRVTTPIESTLAVHHIDIAPGLRHVYGGARDVEALVAGQPLGDPALAIAAEIAAGIPSVAAPIAQQFTAHMLNLDTLGAIAFDKGCYPGQEVTARTQHLGSVKRRALAFRCAASSAPAPGSEVVDAAGAPIGHVIRAAHRGNELAVLAVVAHERGAAPIYLPLAGRPRLEPLLATNAG